MRIFWNFAYVLAGLAVSPMALYRMARYKRYRQGWHNRFGKIRLKNPEKKCIWIHAVSVGEVNATGTIIAELKKAFSGFEIVISTTTDTGFARANALYGKDHIIFFFPLDFSWVMRKVFRNLKPAACLLMELEIWPNFVNIAKQFDTAVVVVNGRISDRGFNRYKKVRMLTKGMFDGISLALVQTQEYADRFEQLGTDRKKIIVTGSLKYDTAQITDTAEGAGELKSKLRLAGRLWVAGGTGNDEEKIILDVFRQLKEQKDFDDLRLVVVPRKPERFDEIAELIEQCGFSVTRYSKIKNGQSLVAGDNHAVILGDTMGDLRKFYSLADIIFVGRSLVPMGGSDMMEAAALGKCAMFGPYAFNFKQTVDALLQGQGAIEVKDGDQLLEEMRKCLTEPNFAEKTAQTGKEIIRKNQGATIRSIEQISKLLKK